MSTTPLQERRANEALQAAKRASRKPISANTWMRYVQPQPPKRCIHCLALIYTEPQEGEPLPCCGN